VIEKLRDFEDFEILELGNFGIAKYLVLNLLL
jgi:hypothetical protein